MKKEFEIPEAIIILLDSDIDTLVVSGPEDENAGQGEEWWGN